MTSEVVWTRLRRGPVRAILQTGMDVQLTLGVTGEGGTWQVDHSKRAWALAMMLVLNIVLAVLLTPLGFESRPTTALQPPGYLAIVAVFAGLALDAAALVLIFQRRTVWGARLAIVGSILFLFPNVVDQTGIFFSVPIPLVVRMLEYAFIVVLLATLVLAWTVRSD